eukprot:Skav225631  [mRNA]  locus=scaffold1513:158935:159450:- [translate_table: standard]
MSKEQKESLAIEGRTETVFSAQKLPKKFFEDLLVSHNVACVIDMTPGDGTLASCCIDSRIPCLCLGVTEEHCEQLEQKMTQYCLTQFTCTGHTLFRDDAAKYLDANGEFRTGPAPEGSESKPPSSEKKKKKKKKNKKSSDSSNEQSEEKETKNKKKKRKRSNSESSVAEEW